MGRCGRHFAYNYLRICMCASRVRYTLGLEKRAAPHSLSHTSIPTFTSQWSSPSSQHLSQIKNVSSETAVFASSTKSTRAPGHARRGRRPAAAEGTGADRATRNGRSAMRLRAPFRNGPVRSVRRSLPRVERAARKSVPGPLRRRGADRRGRRQIRRGRSRRAAGRSGRRARRAAAGRRAAGRARPARVTRRP